MRYARPVQDSQEYLFIPGPGHVFGTLAQCMVFAQAQVVMGRPRQAARGSAQVTMVARALLFHWERRGDGMLFRTAHVT